MQLFSAWSPILKVQVDQLFNLGHYELPSLAQIAEKRGAELCKRNLFSVAFRLFEDAVVKHNIVARLSCQWSFLAIDLHSIDFYSFTEN